MFVPHLVEHGGRITVECPDIEVEPLLQVTRNADGELGVGCRMVELRSGQQAEARCKRLERERHAFCIFTRAARPRAPRKGGIGAAQIARDMQHVLADYLSLK